MKKSEKCWHNLQSGIEVNSARYFYLYAGTFQESLHIIFLVLFAELSPQIGLFLGNGIGKHVPKCQE